MLIKSESTHRIFPERWVGRVRRFRSWLMNTIGSPSLDEAPHLIPSKAGILGTVNFSIKTQAGYPGR
jgi:hypothetical protein